MGNVRQWKETFVPVAMQRAPARAEPGRSPAEAGRRARVRTAFLARAPGLLGALTAVFGFLTIVQAFFGTHHGVHLVSQFAPVGASDTATAALAAAGLLLLRLSGGLRRRQRRAWVGAIIVLVVVAVAHVVRDIDPVPLLVALVLLGLLLASRSRFTAKSDVTTRWLALRVFVEMTAVALGYGLAMMYIAVRSRLVGDPPFDVRLREIVYAMVGIDGPARLTGDEFPRIFHASMLAFAIVIAFTTAYLALRPTHPRARLSSTDEVRLRHLLDRSGGRDSLAYFALRRDKSVVWSPSGKAAITYRVVSGVALASGDPIGDPEAWPGAIAEFLRLVEEYAWIPAVIGCSETGALIYQRDAGLSALQLGDEAIVEVADFTLDGRAMRSVRQACTRVQRSDYEVSVRRVGELDGQELQEVSRLADDWRGSEVERGYSMALSRLGDPADRDCVIATARRDGKLRGVLHFVPWGPDGLSLDLMRRDRSAENGLNELLIVSVIQAGPRLGVHRVSLNFAVFREALERGERIGAGPVLRSWRALLIFLSRWFQIESLYRFNVKFRPLWEPRFLCFPSSRALPRIGVAALEAEEFITRPHVLDRVLRR